MVGLEPTRFLAMVFETTSSAVPTHSHMVNLKSVQTADGLCASNLFCSKPHWWGRRESNPQSQRAGDFKSPAYASSATTPYNCSSFRAARGFTPIILFNYQVIGSMTPESLPVITLGRLPFHWSIYLS